ncbi:glycosyltransferase [Candidatus Woesearchaeota archaeon]|nr:glycosyltransferase [Candidatus Woesearchaeota archaeon]
MRKKILFINHEETKTGAPKILFQIAKELKTKFDVTIISLKKGSMHHDFDKEFDNIIYNPSENIKDTIITLNPDLVYGNTILAYDYVKAAKELNIPAIIHVHELKDSFERILKEDKIKNFNKIANSYIAVSQKVYDYLIKLGCLKIKLIGEFIDVSEVIRKADIIDYQEKFDFITIGTCCMRKGTDIFIDSINILKSKGNILKTAWIGDNVNHIDPFKHKIDRSKKDIKDIKKHVV